MLKSCVFPDIPAGLSDLLFKDENESSRLVVGVIGKSSTPECNKMTCFEIFNQHVSLIENSAEVREGRIKFYFMPDSDVLYVHFETSFDAHIAYKLINESDFDYFLSFNSALRTRFARMLLFATQICHIIVLVEPNDSFDMSYLSIFNSLRVIREKYLLKFLPKFLKNSNVASFLGKEARLCSPRVLFFFESLNKEFDSEAEIFKYEIVFEDEIYKTLRKEYIITNNTAQNLFSIPKNKRFVYFNTKLKLKADPVQASTDLLMKYIDEDCGDLENIRPFRGYAMNYHMDVNTKQEYSKKTERSFLSLIQEHVEEALQYGGFEDGLGRYRGKSHFSKPTTKCWFEAFRILHKILVENPENENFEANDPDYKAFLENFHKILDIDDQFFQNSSLNSYEAALQNYREFLPNFYSREKHLSKLYEALEVFRKYAKGPQTEKLEKKLEEECEAIWNGKQQCEYLSLRGNPCVKPKHPLQDPTHHSSGVIFVSTCNCGKTQGRREDPYTIRQANYEFYQLIANSCNNCMKMEFVHFPFFQPSVENFKAAELINKNLRTHALSGENSNRTQVDTQHQQSLQLSGSQKTQISETNLSLEEPTNKLREHLKNSGSENEEDEDEEDKNEFVIKVGEVDKKENKTMRQVSSTTEYLPSMLNLFSPQGLLPQFPSWNLICIGPSSLYSHNSGLPEHSQSGFLSGTNFLLPWDVKVRLEHSQSWAENYEKTRNRKKHLQNQNDGTFFTLKIFIGNEYECTCGHRFIMSSPTSVLRGSSGGIIRDSGSKVVFNNMPLFFPCPCRQNNVGQLMRIHIVTPKAPVHIHITPKVKIRNTTFTSGLEEIKLTQSAYWILRLPYAYQTEDDTPVFPPTPSELAEVKNPLVYGYLMEGMFGIKEDTEND